MIFGLLVSSATMSMASAMPPRHGLHTPFDHVRHPSSDAALLAAAEREREYREFVKVISSPSAILCPYNGHAGDVGRRPRHNRRPRDSIDSIKP